MKGPRSLLGAGLVFGVAAAWAVPPPWPLADSEAAYALQARELILGRPAAVSEALPVVGAALGLFLAGDSDSAARLAGMLTGPALAGLALALGSDLGFSRAVVLALLWGPSPVLALGGRTVGLAAWVNLFTALAAFGLIRWQSTGRPVFFNAATTAAGILAASGLPGWAALGGLGAAGALSFRLAGKPPDLRWGEVLPAMVGAGAVLAALGGAFGFPTEPAPAPAAGLPSLALLAVYEPLTLAVGATGLLGSLGRLRPGVRPDFVTALGVFWPAAGVLAVLLPVPVDPLTLLGPAVLGLGLAASWPLATLFETVRRDPRPVGFSAGRLALGGAVFVALVGFAVITLASMATGQVSPRVLAGVGAALGGLVAVGLWLGREPGGRRWLLLGGLGLLGLFTAHQFFRVSYGPGPELTGPPRPGPDLVYLARSVRELADRPLNRGSASLEQVPPSVRWALRRFGEGPASGVRVEPFRGDSGLAVVKIPAGYPSFQDGRAFLRWLLYRAYDRLRTVDFVLKQGGL